MAREIQAPNAQENVENLKMALKGEEMDAGHIKVNLDLLNQEIANVGGDITRLGLKLDDLKYLDQKLTSKAGNFGVEFPVQQVESLQSIIEQAESQETQKPQEAEDTLSGGELSPELNLKSEIAKIDDTVQSFEHWLEIFNGMLNNGGSVWQQVDRGLTRNLEQLNKLKGSELVAKGKIPEKTEDKLIEALNRVRQLKNRHDRLQQPPAYSQAA
ncbi:MAG: hypothetical protein NT034_01460 [Candidatus Magasanikbacteria bacterium]|nr:hypothetical protein [Candidatus Magasanikbacteria bacterium]